MLYLISLPEVAYVRLREDIIARWFPPKGMFFKFQLLEYPEGATIDELKSKLLVADKPVILTKEEIGAHKKKYPRN